MEKKSFDWKSIAALGGGTSLVILACKVDKDDAKECIIHMVDAISNFFSTFLRR